LGFNISSIACFPNTSTSGGTPRLLTPTTWCSSIPSSHKDSYVVQAVAWARRNDACVLTNPGCFLQPQPLQQLGDISTVLAYSPTLADSAFYCGGLDSPREWL
jgi:hypothetical protein